MRYLFLALVIAATSLPAGQRDDAMAPHEETASAPAPAVPAAPPVVGQTRRWSVRTESERPLLTYLYAQSKPSPENAARRVIGALLLSSGKHDVAVLHQVGPVLEEGTPGAHRVLSCSIEVDGQNQSFYRCEWPVPTQGLEVADAGPSPLQPGNAATIAAFAAAGNLPGGARRELADITARPAHTLVQLRIEEAPGWRGEAPPSRTLPEPLQMTSGYISLRGGRGLPEMAEFTMSVLENAAQGLQDVYWQPVLRDYLAIVEGYELREAVPLLEMIYPQLSTASERQALVHTAVALTAPVRFLREVAADESAGAARCEAGIGLGRAGVEEGYDIVISAYQDYLNELGKPGPREFDSVRAVLEKQSDLALIDKIASLQKGQTGTAANNVGSMVEKMRYGVMPMDELWQVAEAPAFQARATRVSAIVVLGERAGAGDIERLRALKPWDFGTANPNASQIALLTRLTNDAVDKTTARVRQRAWRTH